MCIMVQDLYQVFILSHSTFIQITRSTYYVFVCTLYSPNIHVIHLAYTHRRSHTSSYYYILCMWLDDNDDDELHSDSSKIEKEKYERMSEHNRIP